MTNQDSPWGKKDVSKSKSKSNEVFQKELKELEKKIRENETPEEPLSKLLSEIFSSRKKLLFIWAMLSLIGFMNSTLQWVYVPDEKNYLALINSKWIEWEWFYALSIPFIIHLIWILIDTFVKEKD